MPPVSTHYPTLEVDLGALTRNYTLLKSHHAKGQCAAVVKANAYGLGVVPVSQALYKAGCHEFFVATLEEGIELRNAFTTHKLSPAAIFIFHGARKGDIPEFAAHGLMPVLNSMEQYGQWDKTQPYALHIDTGMNRLGLSVEEALKLGKTSGLQLILSHLACANEPHAPQNQQQLERFQRAREHFKDVPASFANSSGIFLGKPYHFDLLRPGCSLYGISPNTLLPNPMEGVVTLSAPVLQVRAIDTAQEVGYGGHGIAQAGSTIATVEIGYADGFHRLLSGKTQAYANGVKLPLLGRVSMDMVSLDISALPPESREPGLRVTFIGKEQPVDVLASEAGTIGYEILTGIGRRVKRVYT